PLPLSESDLQMLQGINEEVSLAEVAAIYLPLARLLNLYITSTQTLHEVTETFLGNPAKKVPYVIGMAGSVAVGKSTTARILQTLLAQWPAHPRVDLVATDGFLYPNRVLEERGIMHRKGFPESYDLRCLVRFVADVKSGRPRVTAPVYSHLTYDIVPGAVQVVEEPDIVILEGLNVLQSGATSPGEKPRVFVSDFFDFSIYVDAGEKYLEQWYIERFLHLRDTVFQDEASYFHRYANLSVEEAKEVARRIWRQINLVNLHENILPTRERARLILEKGRHHSVQRVHLRKL
ncbi:MAG: type I pantothenate kinase, partial [Chloroflexota bacterium]|nr:type I pantothenate kinase [Chloroflexota bacterium]